MKKLFTLLTTILVYTSVSAQVLFTTNFQTQADFDAWTVINANGDDKTWKFDDLASPSYVFYPYHSTNAADDWFISPAITSDQTGSIAINYSVQGSSYTEMLEVYVGNAPTIEAMKQVGQRLILDKAETSSHLNLVDVTAGEPIYIGFRACSDADKWRLYLFNVTVQFTNNPVDLRVAEILSPNTDFGLAQETVKVKVVNDGKVAVESFDITLAVNDVVVATENVNQALAVGAEMEYTFTAKADLSTPRMSFVVKAWTSHTDDINTGNDATHKIVLHKAPATTPYVMGFESNEYTDGITIFNLNNDSGNWDVYTDPWWNLAHTGNYCLAYNYDMYNNGDDWAILEPIEITEPGYYALKFWYSGDDTHPEKLGVYYGSTGTPDAMTNKIVEYAPFARGDYEESINIIKFDEPQTIYIGFHAFSDKDENWLCVDDVSLTKVESDQVDLGITTIANPTEFVHKSTSKIVQFTLRNFGIADVNGKVVIKIDNNIVSESELTVKAQEVKELAQADLLANLSEGMHTLSIEVIADNDQATDNNIKSVEFKVMGTPAKIWDFEEGKLPEDFTFRAEDNGTVNPSAGDELNAEGWGLFAIADHQLYGKYVLAGTSWLDGTEKADRWCILPEYTATEDSYLLWDVASFNPNFLETYSVMVSSNGDDSWYYFTEKEFINESANFKTRGLSLSYYANSNIRIAFRIRSKNCEHLILDNIALYGGELTTGVEEVGAASNASIKVSKNAIIVTGVEAVSVELFDMNGASVATVAGNEMPIEGLSAGVYAVRVTTANDTITQKIVIK